MKLTFIQRIPNICSCQGASCWFFIQIGDTGYAIGRRRGDCFLHAEIDTPFQRLRVSMMPLWGKKKVWKLAWLKANNKPGNSYRDRWLRKSGYPVA